MAFGNCAHLLVFKQKSYKWIPPNAVFPSMSLLFVKQQIGIPVEVLENNCSRQLQIF
jgi:hypothetical protein